MVKGLKDDVTRKLDDLKRNKEAIDEILNRAPQVWWLVVVVVVL